MRKSTRPGWKRFRNLGGPEIPTYEWTAFPVTQPWRHDVWVQKSPRTKAHLVSVLVHNLRDIRPGNLIQTRMEPDTACVAARKVDWEGTFILSAPRDAERCSNCTHLPKP
jgi:hypothetical protein